MLTVYTSSETKALNNIKADYEFPENDISPCRLRHRSFYVK